MTDMKKTEKNKGSAKPKKLQLKKVTLKDLGPKRAGPQGGARVWDSNDPSCSCIC